MKEKFTDKFRVSKLICLRKCSQNSVIVFHSQVCMFRMIYLRTGWFCLNTISLIFGIIEMIDLVYNLSEGREEWYNLHKDSDALVFFIVVMRFIRCLQICEVSDLLFSLTMQVFECALQSYFLSFVS